MAKGKNCSRSGISRYVFLVRACCLAGKEKTTRSGYR
jgi:hypothetical protein